MGKDGVDRRTWCKGLLAFGGLALTGAAAQAQQAGSTRTSPIIETNLEDQKIADAVRRGATMEEMAQLREPIAKSPKDAIHALKTGNARFFSGKAQRPEVSAAERRAQILGQTPFAVILGCSDSRVPTEIVFDQGLGSLFITRIAGNLTEKGTLGSIEYGIRHLKTHLVVVLGHEGCGAVKAAMLPLEQRNKEPIHVQELLNEIVPAISKIPKIRDEKAKMREAVIANVRQQVQNLKKNVTIQSAIASNQIAVIGAYYEITSGAVDFFETEEELRVAESGEKRESWREHLS